MASGPHRIADLLARDRAAVWHPCVHDADLDLAPPLPVVGATGTRLLLEDGREILDGTASWWCKSLGHGHPQLRAALCAQAERFEHVIFAHTTHEGVVRLSERLCLLCDGPGAGRFRHVFYAGDGSSGVEVALKLALQGQAQSGHPERTEVACLANGYHGETFGCLSLTTCGTYAQPFSGWTRRCPVLGPPPWRSGVEDPRWLDAEREWQRFEQALDAIGKTLAAIIYEPVLQAAGGMRPYSPELLTRLRRWADAHGVWIIADEIASGMGRCGAMLASHLAEQAEPDIVVLSKGLTGGVLPLSAVVTTEGVRAAFRGDAASGRTFLHSHTFGGNALAVAVANAVLDAFASEDILGQVARRGAAMRAALASGLDGHPHVQQLRGIGMTAACDLLRPGGPGRLGWRVCRAALERGALLRPLGDTVYLCPPLTASDAECARLCEILVDSVAAVLPR